MPKSTAVYPGFFDPFTLGHVNIVDRAKDVFDTVIVAISKDSNKDPLFSFDERMALAEEIFKGDQSVRVEPFQGLLVHYMEKNDYRTILRGLRTVSDFEYEFQMALANKTMSQHIETFFMMTDSRYSFISSTLIKEIARLGGSVDNMVPAIISAKLKDKF
ncbi:MAG: pantetheine-phosphate adenylyltransferase [Bdellovibrionales bacterium]|nr:pantetheine-phosphate adenylyltransferase [Bdellovibrionales bacterium]